MKQIAILCFFLAMLFLNSVYGLQFKDCGSKSGKFTKVTVSDCDTTQSECVLKRNSTVSINIEFSLEENVTSVKTVVHGRVMGVEMPFSVPNSDACVNSGFTCPLEKDASYAYGATLPVLRNYPRINVIVKWELKDQNNQDIVCVEIPAAIK